MWIWLKFDNVVRVAIVMLIALHGVNLPDYGVAMAQSTQMEVDEILHGEALAKENCSKCHAIGLDGDSPNENAPAFRKLEERRLIETVAQMLIDKESTKHSDMPHFTITPLQAIDIAEWIFWVQPIAHGKRLVEQNCSRCHAIGLDDESSFPAAPPFRNLSMYYPIQILEEAFAERIETGHPAMPVFEVTIDQLRDMLAYMETLQKP
jgi:mono/diheme cytochrome c family protein